MDTHTLLVYTHQNDLSWAVYIQVYGNRVSYNKINLTSDWIILVSVTHCGSAWSQVRLQNDMMDYIGDTCTEITRFIACSL